MGVSSDNVYLRSTFERDRNHETFSPSISSIVASVHGVASKGSVEIAPIQDKYSARLSYTASYSSEESEKRRLIN